MRTAELSRNTKETQIKIVLCLEGGPVNIKTGIGFFDHMLTAFAVHGNFGLDISVSGDLEVDCHHTVEDTGIVLGQVFKIALGSIPVTRFGSFSVPMDESLATCHLDISNRPYLVFHADFLQERVGGFDTCMCEEFFRAFAVQAGLTLHIDVPYGSNAHHQSEAIFKAVAHALKAAVVPMQGEVLSTKGVL